MSSELKPPHPSNVAFGQPVFASKKSPRTAAVNRASAPSAFRPSNPGITKKSTLSYLGSRQESAAEPVTPRNKKKAVRPRVATDEWERKAPSV